MGPLPSRMKNFSVLLAILWDSEGRKVEPSAASALLGPLVTAGIPRNESRGLVDGRSFPTKGDFRGNAFTGKGSSRKTGYEDARP